MATFCSLLLATLLLSSAAADTELRERHKRQAMQSCKQDTYLFAETHDTWHFNSLDECAATVIEGTSNVGYPNSADWEFNVYRSTMDPVEQGDYYVNVVYDIDIEQQSSCSWDKLILGANTAQPVEICGEQRGAFSARLNGTNTRYRITFSSDSIINRRGFNISVSFSDSPDFNPDVHPHYTQSVNSDYFDSSSGYNPSYSSNLYGSSYGYSSGYGWSSNGYGSSSDYYPSYSSSYDYYWPNYGSSNDYGYSSSYGNYWPSDSYYWSSNGYGSSSDYYPSYSSSYDYFWPGYGSSNDYGYSSSYGNYWSNNYYASSSDYSWPNYGYGYSSSYDNYWPSYGYGYSSSYDNHWPSYGYGYSSSYDNYWPSYGYGYSSSYDNHWPSYGFGYSSSYDNYWPSYGYGYSSSYDNHWPTYGYGYSSSYDNWNSDDYGQSSAYYGYHGPYNGGSGGISYGEERAALIQSLKTELRELADAVKEAQQSLADLEQNYHNIHNN